MSLETWKAEFYPVPASSFTAETSTIDLVEHSLRKWIGLREENLRKHGISTNRWYREIACTESVNDPPLQIDSTTCALCVVAEEKHKKEDYAAPSMCKHCILTKLRNGLQCDEVHILESASPWSIWLRSADPEPMIKLLKEAVEFLKFK